MNTEKTPKTNQPKTSVPNLVDIFETNGKGAFKEAVSQMASKAVLEVIKKSK